jgi:hypothetical protein
MDAAQMLTAREIARQCEQLASAARQREAPAAAPLPRRNLRAVEPVTDRISAVTAEVAEDPVPARPPAESSAAQDGGLTDRELGILAFERQWWKQQGTKERAIHELFDMSVSRYYQILNALLDKPAALRADPMLVKRLRKVRAARQRARTARRLGIE